MQILEARELARLLELLRERGHRLLGPTLRDGAIVHAELRGAEDLPIGWTDVQSPGRYRIARRDDAAYFGYVLGPQGPRAHLTPPREPLVQIRRHTPEGRGALTITAISEADERPVALIGVRACEVAAMRIQGEVWTSGEHRDPRVQARRERAFVVAVECLEPGGLCFCTSMQTGPAVEADYDLRLTERLDDEGHRFVLEVGSERGRVIAEQLERREADDEATTWRSQALARSAAAMGRTLDTTDLPALLFANLDHPRWQQVAERCLACGNCTQVCPTCFCHRVEEVAPLDREPERERVWDSCFSDEHSRIHGAQFQAETRQRYRQWLTHKFGSWVAQFGSSGCVGCGRCIAWCPVGIDVTEELAALREGASTRAPVLPLSPARSSEPAVVGGDPMLPQVARVRAVKAEIPGVVTLEIEPDERIEARAGQFAMLGLPAIGEVPISMSGQQGALLQHTLRAVGATTTALAELRVGDELTLRGPFGRGWPLAELRGRELVVIAGGLGLAPLRGAIRQALAEPELFPFVRVLYGARSPSELLFDHELLAWQREHRHCKVHVTVDRAAPGWTGHVGVVTTLIRRKRLSTDAAYLVCGPDNMMHFVLRELDQIGVPAERIWLSIERNMKCAVGLCGRCQFGPHFVCKDGPVFRRDQLGGLLGHEGF
ncbi:4Fe-4S dicluster domain-containing protein [Nannocystaceae bacterium ST9]